MLSDVLKIFDTTAEQGLGKEITKRFEEQIGKSLDPKAAAQRVIQDINILGASALIRGQIGFEAVGLLADTMQALLATIRKAKRDLETASLSGLIEGYTKELTSKIPTAPPFEIPAITIPNINENLVLFDAISIPMKLQLDIQIQTEITKLLNRLRDEVRSLALLPAQLVGIAEGAAKQILIDKLKLLEEFILLSLEGFHFGFEYAVATPDWQTLFAAVTL